MNTVQATGRPTQPVPVLPRLGIALLCIVALLELLYRAAQDNLLGGVPLAGTLTRVAHPYVSKYAPVRAWVIGHPALAGVLATAIVAALLVALRYWLLF